MQFGGLAVLQGIASRMETSRERERERMCVCTYCDGNFNSLPRLLLLLLSRNARVSELFACDNCGFPALAVAVIRVIGV